ncbi:hypothetical protein JRQ81_013059 [Phrynocephalus forsythii]|uniref:GPI ethanolamine phosphate transferase 3 n=1 Tax=Phrynocephalus forsythii TaxID=171643 RepID=A0A9Q1B3P6_9SAUR|nr:hypothetical protein JRQ81_013059 [Phrynocephalus forsythii]
MQRVPVLLFLAWTGFLFWAALGLFTSGFLLTRVELPNRSACLDFPGGAGSGSRGSRGSRGSKAGDPLLLPLSSCWLPQRRHRFPKAVLVLIDALKFEFAHYDPARQEPRPYQNRLPFLHALATQQPRHGRLYRFRADPPTTTMQRIKGITTGSLPTFVDAGSNFASYAIREDNLIWQLAQNGRRVVFMGDDTWDGLFPQAFFRSHFFPSFNVKDLHTVDDGILQHLYPTGARDSPAGEPGSHAGPPAGRAHPFQQHRGGDDRPLCGRGRRSGFRPCPAGSLQPQRLAGGPLPALIRPGGPGPPSRKAAAAPRPLLGCHGRARAAPGPGGLSGASAAGGSPRPLPALPAGGPGRLRGVVGPLPPCPHGGWLCPPRFLLPALLGGLQGFRPPGLLLPPPPGLPSPLGTGRSHPAGAGTPLGMVQGGSPPALGLGSRGLPAGLLLALLGPSVPGSPSARPRPLPEPEAVGVAGPALPLGLLFLRCCAMVSDSFVMAEGQVAPFLLLSLVLPLALRLHWQGGPEGSPLGWPALGPLAALLACVRLSGLFRQCREETPCCQSSGLLAPLSSLQDPQAKNLQYLLCLAGLAGLAGGVRCWLRHYGNLNRPSGPVLLVRWGFPLLALWIGGYWAVTSGAEEALAKLQAWVQLALVAFPRGVFALVLAGLLLVLWDPVTVFVRDGRETPGTGAPIVSPSSEAELLLVIPRLYRRMQESLRSRLEEAKAGDGVTVAAYGLGSAYSAALLISLTLLGFLLVTLHHERLCLAFLLLFLQAFALLWILAACLSASSPQADPFAVPWEAPVAWALAATQFFYATGHQPVFPTLHWNAAFVGFEGGHDNNLLPALLVGANTFASHILFAVGCPLLLLWPFVCETLPGSKGRRPKGQEQMMEMRLREAPEKFSAALLQLGLKYLLVLGVQLLACVLAAIVLRRHLMVWKVFAPKFLFEALGFVVSSVFLLLGIGLVLRVDCAVSRWFKRVILAQSR